MDNGTQEKKQPAPYISWKTFTSFVANIHGKVPAQIDPSVLRNMSGTARSQLLSALKFLDLIDVDGTTKDRLKKLADSYNSEQWKPQLHDLIAHAYARVVNGLNITAATPAMLRERFRNAGGVDGGTVDSAMRFYLGALKEADISFSPHLVMRQRAPRGSTTRRRGALKMTDGEEEEEEFDIHEDTFEVSLRILGVNGKLLLPEDLRPEQWEAISEYVKMVIGLRQRTQGKS
jgi:hypothetical protein